MMLLSLSRYLGRLPNYPLSEGMVEFSDCQEGISCLDQGHTLLHVVFSVLSRLNGLFEFHRFICKLIITKVCRVFLT